MPSLRDALLILWATGAILFLTPLIVGLLRVQRLRRHARPWASSGKADLPVSVDVVIHEQVRAPITCGLRRPLIVLPADAPQWGESDLRRVLLHELEHVRRRDWPVHVAARGITALYWFHPLVWIAWRQLSLECERACDDAVVREEDGPAYAEQLVSLARRITKHEALPLLSIARRSNLSARVGAMLANNIARNRVRGATVLAVATTATIAALAIGPLQAVTVSQRTAPQSARGTQAFESSSIHRTAPLPTGGGNCWPPRCQVQYSADGRVAGTSVDLVDLIVSAYGTSPGVALYRWQVEGAPKWADARYEDGGKQFDVQAIARRGANADDMRQMLKTMLADRFGLAVHRETRAQKVYELVVEPGGHKLQPPGDKKYVASEDIWMRVDPKTMIATLSVDGMTMGQLTRNIAFPLLTLVHDRTALTGTYRINARWSAVPGSREIFDAFPAQLGLRLREVPGRVEYLIVDRAEQPRLDAPQARSGPSFDLYQLVAGVLRGKR
jgi:uncharacterized protein (TIGR03435 family)